MFLYFPPNNLKGTTLKKLANHKHMYASALGHPIFSPVSNGQCKFPFTFEGNTYMRCTNLGRDIPIKTEYFEGRLHKPHWCATDVDENNVMLNGRWGYCSDECSPNMSPQDVLEHPVFNMLPVPRSPKPSWKRNPEDVIPKEKVEMDVTNSKPVDGFDYSYDDYIPQARIPETNWRNNPADVIPKEKVQMDVPERKSVDGSDYPYFYLPRNRVPYEPYPGRGKSPKWKELPPWMPRNNGWGAYTE